MAVEQSENQVNTPTGSELAMAVTDKNLDGGREHLLSTAVKFLLNPRVQKTSILQKVEFLRQKGLTEHEINAACQRAGIDVNHEQDPSRPAPVQTPNQLVPAYLYPVAAASVWTKARDVANLVALISIGSYSLYYLWKQFLAPKLFGVRNSREQNYEKLLISISTLNENVTELKNLIRSIQETQTLQKQIEASSSKSKTSVELRDIKNELSAIKGLLLGRAQFPTSPSSGGIPSWQMLEAEGDEGDESNNSKDSVKMKRKERKSQRKQEKPPTTTSSGEDAATTTAKGESTEADTMSQFVDMTGSSSSTVNIVRRQPQPPSSVEGDSNNGFTSGSSCEVVFIGSEKNYSNSETSSE